MQDMVSKKEYFERSRDFFDARFSKHIFATKNAYKRRYHFALSNLNPKPQDMFLDVGCAQGGSLLACNQRGVKSYGLDFSLEALKIAKRLGSRNLICADAHKIPLHNKLFDKIIVLQTLEIVSDKKAALGEIRRVAKTGAKIYIEVRNGSFAFRRLTNYIRVIFTTAKGNNYNLFRMNDPLYHEWIDLLNGQGLIIEKVYKSPACLHYEDPVQFLKTAMIQISNLLCPVRFCFTVSFLCKL